VAHVRLPRAVAFGDRRNVFLWLFLSWISCVTRCIIGTLFCRASVLAALQALACIRRRSVCCVRRFEPGVYWVSVLIGNSPSVFGFFLLFFFFLGMSCKLYAYVGMSVGAQYFCHWRDHARNIPEVPIFTCYLLVMQKHAQILRAWLTMTLLRELLRMKHGVRGLNQHCCARFVTQP